MKASRPNILFIQCDQLTAFALQCYGNKTSKTPHIDALAESGTVFTNAYCNFPICVPSRASMMTGQLASRVGVWDNGAELCASIPTFAHHLGAQGYKTILCGKMHFVGPDQLHGFQERLTTDIYPSDFGWTADWSQPGYPEAGSKMTLRGVVEAGVCQRSMQIDYDDEVENRAIQKLYDLARDDDARPFFLAVSFTHPHNPFVTTREYWDRYTDEEIDLPKVSAIPFDKKDPHSRRLHYMLHADEYDVSTEQTLKARRAYYGMVSYLDDKVGRLRKILNDTGLSENTVVIFTSDHGDMIGERGMWYKMCLFESAMRVPLIIALPNEPTIDRIENNVSLLDLFPTLIEIGARGNGVLHGGSGRSLTKLLKGEEAERPNVVLGEYSADGATSPCFMVRDGDFKIIWSEDDGAQLFNLADDPHEMDDLANSPATEAIQQKLLSIIHENWDPLSMREQILASQRDRAFLHSTAAVAGYPKWDFEPRIDPSKQYVRSGMSPAVVKGKAQFPKIEPTVPDHPRR